MTRTRVCFIAGRLRPCALTRNAGALPGSFLCWIRASLLYISQRAADLVCWVRSLYITGTLKNRGNLLLFLQNKRGGGSYPVYIVAGPSTFVDVVPLNIDGGCAGAQ